MRKDILEKALRLADKSKMRLEDVIVASPKQLAKPATVEMLTARLYTRVTPSQHKQLLKHVAS